MFKLYEPSPTPWLFVAPVENMEGRVPITPLFLAGNSTPTIPHMFGKRKDSGFPFVCADAAAAGGRRAVMAMRITPGCGSVGVASHAWVV